MTKHPLLFKGLAVLAPLILRLTAQAQTEAVIDPFNPGGTGGYNYASGHISDVWANWFGGAFQSLAWDPASDADTNSGSGSLKITANFFGSDGNSQWSVYDAKGTYPPINGRQYTQLEFDVRFAPGSALTTNGGAALFGRLLFGVANGWSQDWFGGVDIPASATNWMHVSVPINAASDPNLANIYNVILHIYGPYYTPMSGSSTCWVDNLKFTGPAPVTTNCIVNWNEVHQRIDGFGASSGFRSGVTTNQWDIFTPAMADQFFSPTNGIGLSLLKAVIVAGATGETNLMQMAQARGAKVWCTPYTPDAAFKSNKSLNGGSFLSASNQAYANELAGFVANMQANYGVNIYALSIQNEPDVAADYQSCLWTPQQIHDFVPYLHAALQASNVAATKIMLAEGGNWQTNYYLTAMSDPAVATNVDIIAAHDYDGSPPSVIPTPLPKFANPNAALWESEVSTFDPFDGSMDNALYWANRIHRFMTEAEVNAFNYWWLIVDNNNNDNEGLTDLAGNPAKRMYVLGNYSRFVRPGFYRIGVANNAATAISAYKNSASGDFAIVAVNTSFTTVTQVFNLTYFTASSVTPWITSDTLSLSSQAPVGVTNSAFTYVLPPLSVVTFVGQAAVGNPVATTCTLGASPNGAPLFTPVTFTSRVSPAPPDFEAVVFLDGATVIGTGTLSGGVATCTSAALAVGAHRLTAAYGGDSAYQASTSPEISQTVINNPNITARLAIKLAADVSYNRCAINANNLTPATKGGAGVLNTTNWNNWYMTGATTHTNSTLFIDLNGQTNGAYGSTTAGYLSTAVAIDRHNAKYDSVDRSTICTNNNVGLLNTYASFPTPGVALTVTNLDPVFTNNTYNLYVYYVADEVGRGQVYNLTNYWGPTPEVVAGSQTCSLYTTTNWSASNNGHNTGAAGAGFGNGSYYTNLPANLQGTGIFVQGAWSINTGTKDVVPAWEPFGADFIVFSNLSGGSFVIAIGAASADDGIAAIEIVANPAFGVSGPVVTPATNAYAGETVNLACTPSGGLTPFSQQWQGGADGLNWTNVTGATGTNLVLANFSANNAGYYQMIYTAGSQSVTSAVVRLTYYATPPAIGPATASPGGAVPPGTTVTMNCLTNGGAPPFSLQWQVSGNGLDYTNLPGATSLPLMLVSVTAADSRYYQCRFTAASQSVTSAPVHLTVSANPVIEVRTADGHLVLDWPLGMLLQATNLLGPWVTNNAAAPYTSNPTGPAMFYRVQVQ